MTLFTRRFVVSAGVAVLFQACLPTEPCACPPALTHAVVFGSVRTDAGNPAAGAEIQATVYSSVCGRGYSETGAFANRVRADSVGSYELRFYSVSGPRAACVRVIARSSSTPRDSTSVDAAILMRSERDQPERVRVDLVLADALDLGR